MKLVLDTNVIVSAFRSSRGASNLLLRWALEDRFQLLCSTALFLEYEDVLNRKDTRDITGHSQADVTDIMNALAAISAPVDVSFRIRPRLKDADDEMVLEAAVNGGADAIVTHNMRDFYGAQDLNIRLATPSEIIGKLMK